MKSYIYLVYKTGSNIITYIMLGENWIDRIGRFFTWMWAYHFTCFMIANQWRYWLPPNIQDREYDS